ncbi:LysR family transcriptional regulator [Brevundimonas sp.]|uniref:LysR family transcriptional regulator n=1 Tax=Brevundimonas sp. TaxID=1871086 RepID=UPI001A325F86|nr:LysR family transcriptional regulator [Brevundimonas sp.]MBJ7483874.1 LysR family transcriptional regulator [Brevundimonas sp.]
MLDSRLKHAVSVGKLSSFSRAAEACGLSQSAVSKSVADLERQLGYLLFHRTSRSVMMTEEGREFIDRAARLLADSAELLGGVDQNANPYAGPLRVGLFPGSLDGLLTDPLIRLLRRHTDVRFEIVVGDSERGTRLLSRGDIDIAFGLEAALSIWPEFKCERVATIEIVPFVRLGHPLLSQGPVGRDALVEYPFIVPSSSEPYTSIIEQLYEDAGQRPGSKIHVTDQFSHVRQIVASSQAIGMIARQFTAKPWFDQGFATLEDTEILDPLTLCYAVRKRWPVKPAARALVGYIRQDWTGQSG